MACGLHSSVGLGLGLRLGFGLGFGGIISYYFTLHSGDYFLLLHTAFYSRVGQIAIFKSLSTIRLGVLIEICQSSQSSDFVTVHRHTDLSGFG